MDGGEYKPCLQATAERIVASLLIGLWIAIAWWEFGLPIAVRAGVFYMVALTFVWIPDLMARVEYRGHQRDAGASGPVSPMVFRWVAWLMILGPPAGWFLFSRTFRG